MFLFFPIPALTRTVLISLIALLTLLGIMLRPWRVSEAIIALTGAGALLLLGLLSPVAALATLLRDWNTFFFFLGMMSLSALAEVSGLFDWLAVQAARLSGNSSRRLFFNTFLLGSLISHAMRNEKGQIPRLIHRGAPLRPVTPLCHAQSVGTPVPGGVGTNFPCAFGTPVP